MVIEHRGASLEIRRELERATELGLGRDAIAAVDGLEHGGA